MPHYTSRQTHTHLLDPVSVSQSGVSAPASQSKEPSLFMFARSTEGDKGHFCRFIGPLCCHSALNLPYRPGSAVCFFNFKVEVAGLCLIWIPFWCKRMCLAQEITFHSDSCTPHVVWGYMLSNTHTHRLNVDDVRLVNSLSGSTRLTEMIYRMRKSLCSC